MYGGNLTYPKTQVFYNSVPDDGSLGKVYLNGTKKHFLLYKTGDDIVAGNVSYSEILNMDATKRIAAVYLDDKIPNMGDKVYYEYGFTVEVLARDPGVYNSLPRGLAQPFYSKTEDLLEDDNNKGHFTADAMKEQVATIRDMINGWTQEYGDPTNFGGPIVHAPDTAVIKVNNTLATGDVTLTINGGAGQNNPGTEADAQALVDWANTLDGVYALVSDGNAVILADEGVTLESAVDGTNAEYSTDNTRIWLVTLDKWYKDYTYVVTGLYDDATVDYVQNGSFAVKGLGSDDVFRIFAHRKNNKGFANFSRNEQPIDTDWIKYVVYNELSTGSLTGGASHGDEYMQVVEIYIPKADKDKTGFLKSDGTTTADLNDVLAEFTS